MKKIDDEIFKFLSGSMKPDEVEKFNSKIKASVDFKNQLDEAKNILAELRIGSIDTNEKYFVNLIPRMRERIEAEHRLRKQLYYAVPVFAIALIVFLVYPRSNTTFENYYGELAQAVVNNIDDKDVSQKYLNDVSMEPAYAAAVKSDDFTLGLENAVNNIPTSYLNVIGYSNAETYQSLGNLSGDEIDNLCKELNDFKLQ
jgi:hypothetical protein